MKQFFGSKRYLYQNGRKVAHIHIVNGIYHFHGHNVNFELSSVKKEFSSKREFDEYIEQHEFYFEREQQ
ncbi:hypothetical protein MWQ64_002434 [Staphylococcus pseudintermedius]|nr:hypothetical protein [Staphylococcus pseudintermedius]EJA1886732.1 hypothetical protein [Staphylococcus pseudintermedius]